VLSGLVIDRPASAQIARSPTGGGRQTTRSDATIVVHAGRRHAASSGQVLAWNGPRDDRRSRVSRAFASTTFSLLNDRERWMPPQWSTTCCAAPFAPTIRGVHPPAFYRRRFCFSTHSSRRYGRRPPHASRAVHRADPRRRRGRARGGAFGDEAVWLEHQRPGFDDGRADRASSCSNIIPASSAACFIEKPGSSPWGDTGEGLTRKNDRFVTQAVWCAQAVVGGALGRSCARRPRAGRISTKRVPVRHPRAIPSGPPRRRCSPTKNRRR